MLYCVAAFSAEGAWDPESYNPKPANGDLILPMPCGGQMVFRQVNVPSSGALDDYRITLGSHEEDQGYAGVPPRHLAGRFLRERGQRGRATLFHRQV